MESNTPGCNCEDNLSTLYCISVCLHDSLFYKWNHSMYGKISLQSLNVRQKTQLFILEVFQRKMMMMMIISQPDIDSIIIIFIIWNLCVVEKKESFERRRTSNIQGYIIVWDLYPLLNRMSTNTGTATPTTVRFFHTVHIFHLCTYFLCVCLTYQSWMFVLFMNQWCLMSVLWLGNKMYSILFYLKQIVCIILSEWQK